MLYAPASRVAEPVSLDSQSVDFALAIIDGQMIRAKWPALSTARLIVLQHGTIYSASARHGHDSYSASTGTTRV
jgi:hypothetical protein